MTSWKGKTRGNVLGYKIFITVLKYLGLPFAYFLLRFVSFYYFLFNPSSFKIIWSFYRERMHFGFLKSAGYVYKNFYVFGQVLIDKVVAMAGFKAKFSFDFDGEEHLRQMVKDKTGGLLISAHIGNFEMAGHMLERLQTKINIIMFDAEHERIKEYISSVTNRSFHVIVIKEDMSHIYEIIQAFDKKEIVCMHGDRFVEGNKTVLCNFLGEDTYFPAGPFYLAMKNNVPVSFVFAMKEKKNHYHFYATRSKIYHQPQVRDKRDVATKVIIDDYIREMELTIKKYPAQWFNYYNFWKK